MDNIVCIVGPTASGKTKLSVELALAMDAEIVSFDSMQLYKRMDIGTAKPTPAEQKGVRHHMLDVLEPWESCSVSRYTAMADACVQDILARGKPVILVGGTGLYLDALISGRSFAPGPQTGRREELTRLADEQGIEPLLQTLRQIDPQSAARLHPSDRRRIIRALEIYYETGQTMTEHDRQTRSVPPKYTPVRLGLNFADRKTLYDRIDLRAKEMFSQGLAQEVRALLDAGVPETATAMQAIGYKEVVRALEGEISMDEALAQVQQSSRRYAKRQLTWFRRDPDVRWLEAGLPFSELFSAARRELSVFDTENR